MVDTIGMVNAVAGAPAYNGRKLRQLNGVAFAGATASRPLGVRSGVRPGTPSTTVTATSSTWTVQPCAGNIDGQSAVEAGGYTFAFDAVATGAVAAASGSFARVDIVYVQIDDPSESDGSSVPAVTRKYLAGLVANTPQALPARSILLAHINVPISGGGSPTVTWKAPYCAAAGGTVHFNTKAEMDAEALATPTLPNGTTGRVLADNGEYVKAGGGWKSAGGMALVASASVTAASSVTIDGCFTADFENYDVVFDLTTSVASGLNGSFRSGGSTDAAAVYDFQRFVVSNATATPSQSLAVTLFFLTLISVAGRHAGKISLFAPAVAKATTGTVFATSTSNPMSATSGFQQLALQHRAASAFDGLLIAPNAGTITGTVRVYGYNN